MTRRLCQQCSIPLRRQGTPPVEGTRIHQAKGLCSYCYQSKLRSGELSARPRHEFTATEIKCYVCEQWKPYDKFKKKQTTKTGREYRCSFCAKLWERYALTFPEYLSLFESVSGQCEICGSHFQDIWSSNVDHDHSCCPGVTSCGWCVRGLLCTPCNAGLGMLKDDPQRLEKAIEYLVRTS